MPVIPVPDGVTFPSPFEPDIENIRRLSLRTTHLPHVNKTSITSTSPTGCRSYLDAALTFRAETIPLSQLQQFINCSDQPLDDAVATDLWWIRLLLDHDIVYYAFPVMLTIGIFCDVIGASVLTSLVIGRNHANTSMTSSYVTGSRGSPASSRGTGNVYLLWSVVLGVALLVCCSVRRLSDYVDIEGSGGVEFIIRARLLLTAIDEWLSYASLWLLVAMDLDKALQLTATDPVNDERPMPLLSSRSAYVVDDDLTQYNHCETSKSFETTSFRKEAAVSCAIFAVCLVSALPHFFCFQLVETNDVATNRTIIVPRRNDELTDSFEFRIVYYWYVIGLTMLLPVPVLVIVSVVVCQALASRQRRSKQTKHVHQNGNTRMFGKSIMARNSASVTTSEKISGDRGGDEVALTGRLLVVSTILCLLFTLPRTILTCVEGLPSSRWTTMTIDPPDLDVESSVISIMIRSLVDFSFYLYYASSLPLLSSYHDDFHGVLARFLCCRYSSCCRSNRCRGKIPLTSIKDQNPGRTQIRNHGMKKTVKFDSRTIEIEMSC